MHRSGGPVDDLLTLADVDRMLTAGGLRRPAVRLVRDGHPLDPSTWTRRVRTGASVVDDLIDPARLLDLHRDGATVVLQSMQRWWPPVGAFCRALESELGHAVQANAYLTPAGGVGLTPHHDTHDVFVVQVHGTKQWTVRAPMIDAPLRRHRSTADEASGRPVLFEVELSAGDCLYLPRGVVHSAAAQQRASLHLTFGVLATTGHDVVTRLASLAAESSQFRRALPPRWAEDVETGAVAVTEVVAALRRFLDDLDPVDVAADLARRYRSGRTPDLQGQLLQLDQLDDLADASVVRARPGLDVIVGRCGVDDRDERLVLRVGRKSIDLPVAIAPAVDLLVDGEPHAVAELSDWLSLSSRMVLVRRLVREGVLVTERER